MEPLFVLTIGQTPRNDIEKELRQVLGARPIEMHGALDGLSTEDINQFSPESAADTFHTHLANGADVIISKKAVTARLEKILATTGSRPVLVACTGKFSGLAKSHNVLFPSTILEGVVDAVAPANCTLGVLVPLVHQIEPLSQQWRRPDREVVVAAVKPGEDASQAAAALARAGVDLVVLDCFGYETALLSQVRKTTGVPVLSAVRCTAHVASELLG
ncbi:MAG: AroM family protein [Acidimicrobiales bacterium]|nr:AroM family protein [Acidimicrobiales bacterium]